MRRWLAPPVFYGITMPVSHVFDTYAKKAKGGIMHFDVVIDEQDPQKALECARKWLESVGHSDAVVTQETCYFCHSAEAPAELRKQIDEQGYAIYKLEGCPKD